MKLPRSKPTKSDVEATSKDDLAAFRAAVSDVTPVSVTGRVLHDFPKPSPIPVQTLLDEKQEVADSLSDHDPWEAGFETGEELSFLRQGLPQNVLKKLRRGHWVIQDELDLHGLTRIEARTQLVEFLNASRKDGHRCIRIIHGKGLGSINREPILKQLVRIWLVQRDEVLAFCQARPMDGGSGAAIVLLKSA